MHRVRRFYPPPFGLQSILPWTFRKGAGLLAGYCREGNGAIDNRVDRIGEKVKRNSNRIFTGSKAPRTALDLQVRTGRTRGASG